MKTNTFTGIYFMPSRNKWKCEIHNDNKRHHIGFFDTETEALFYYNREAERIGKTKNDFPLCEWTIQGILVRKDNEIKKLKNQLALVRKAIDN